ncbi:MAG: hypothetical protein P1U87_21415 [Verrucomicrobiales bacterium]|nr:hypothetical protein [Verrucomicrobiales bacterium]
MMRILVLLLLLFTVSVERSFAQSDTPPSPSSNGLFSCKPGPWGDLDYYYVHLEAPDHIVDLVAAPSSRTSWFFPGKTLEEVKAILTTALITREEQEAMLEEALQFQLNPPYRIFPPTEIVERMNPLSRQALYRELRPWSENRFFHRPVIIETGNVESWFADSGLSAETISRIARMTYRIGDSLAFSDVSAILSRISTDHEEREFLKALTRTRSLVLRLKVSQESDFESLKNYWSVGKKSKDILPFFESISQTPDRETIDVIHLLPPTPRKYLNTFPPLSLGIEGQFPGSLWTTMNFFRYSPLIDFDDPEYSKAFVRKFYETAEQPYQFGDIILINDPVSGRTSHTCNYVADDIVYTKNGRSILKPFVFMKLSDMLSLYSTEARPAIEVWRARE